MAPRHVYELTATPNGPKNAYAVVSDQFQGPAAPIASFVFWGAYLTLFTDASASYYSDGVIVDYQWDWGDGNFSIGVTANHTSLTWVYWTITLKVIDNDDMTDTISKDCVVLHCCMIPTADFTISIYSMSVHVDASGSFDPDGTIESYDWDFGGTARQQRESRLRAPMWPLACAP
ncbi:MAG: hypothetical protein A3K60_02175 [Euryarchaeota archaeon RBG_19FT_COMBO_56_21]|nr:MAG: hypothetical protein A3K60_02175 [Euryarchaeota archaeon RBG_19FT_COMBO_56_21]